VSTQSPASAASAETVVPKSIYPSPSFRPLSIEGSHPAGVFHIRP